jgi:hypothetical protein
MMDARWFLGATRQELEVAPDLVGELVFETIERRRYGEAPSLGLSFVFDDGGRVDTVHLHAEGHDGYAAYHGEMPLGVRFGASRDDVHAARGAPATSGSVPPIAQPGPDRTWDRFDLADMQLNVQYSGAGAVHLVTLMRFGAVSNGP